MEKLGHLIEHWIEHSKGHTDRYEEWAVKIKDSYPEVAEKLREAAQKFREGEKLLEEAARILGR